MLTAIRRQVFWWRIVPQALVLVLAVVAVFTTFDHVEITGDSGATRPVLRQIDCGSPLHPTSPTDLSAPDAAACEERLDHTRGTRLAALGFGLGLSILLMAMQEERVRRFKRYPLPLLGLPALEVSTERLLIRPTKPDDLMGLLATIDDEMRAANGWGSSEVGLFAAKVSGTLPESLPVVLTIVDRSSGAIVGALQVSRRARRERPMVGQWLGPAHRRQGYGTEALQALISALHRAGFPAVEFSTTPDNAAVAGLARRIGAVPSRRRTRRRSSGGPASISFIHRDSP